MMIINKKKIAGLFCALAIIAIPQATLAEEKQPDTAQPQVSQEYPKSQRPIVFNFNGQSRICAHLDVMKVEYADGAKLAFAGTLGNGTLLNTIHVKKGGEFIDFLTEKNTKFTCLQKQGTALDSIVKNLH